MRWSSVTEKVTCSRCPSEIVKLRYWLAQLGSRDQQGRPCQHSNSFYSLQEVLLLEPPQGFDRHMPHLHSGNFSRNKLSSNYFTCLISLVSKINNLLYSGSFELGTTSMLYL